MNNRFPFSWTILRPGDPPPPRSTISTAFLVGFIDSDYIIAIQNDRGWDLPGGHLLPHETLQQGLAREAFEEAGATFTNAHPCIVLSSPNYDKLVVGLVSRSCEIEEDCRPIIDDAIRRDVFSTDCRVVGLLATTEALSLASFFKLRDLLRRKTFLFLLLIDGFFHSSYTVAR